MEARMLRRVDAAADSLNFRLSRRADHHSAMTVFCYAAWCPGVVGCRSLLTASCRRSGRWRGTLVLFPTCRRWVWAWPWHHCRSSPVCYGRESRCVHTLVWSQVSRATLAAPYTTSMLLAAFAAVGVEVRVGPTRLPVSAAVITAVVDCAAASDSSRGVDSSAIAVSSVLTSTTSTSTSITTCASSTDAVAAGGGSSSVPARPLSLPAPPIDVFAHVVLRTPGLVRSWMPGQLAVFSSRRADTPADSTLLSHCLRSLTSPPTAGVASAIIDDDSAAFVLDNVLALWQHWYDVVRSAPEGQLARAGTDLSEQFVTAFRKLLRVFQWSVARAYAARHSDDHAAASSDVFSLAYAADDSDDDMAVARETWYTFVPQQTDIAMARCLVELSSGTLLQWLLSSICTYRGDSAAADASTTPAAGVSVREFAALLQVRSVGVCDAFVEVVLPFVHHWRYRVCQGLRFFALDGLGCRTSSSRRSAWAVAGRQSTTCWDCRRHLTPP